MRIIAALVWVCAMASAAQIPAGTELYIRLETPVAASTSADNQTVAAVVVMPVMDAAGNVIVPSGSKLIGKVKDHKPATEPEKRALLRLVFDRLAAPKGATAKIDSRVVEVDNARETVDQKGDIIGILASESLSARMDAGIGKLSERYPALGGILAGVKAGIVGEANPDIQYDAGVEMRVRLEKPVEWAANPTAPAVQPIQPASELTQLVNKQTFRTMAVNPPNPSDITNLMFIGTEQQIEEAFKAAGWHTAHALTGESTMETIRAVIEMRGYKEAPVSILTLDGKAPDLVFQKQNNTFAQRHHLRIWRRPATFQDRPVWVCAATHDIGIDFSEENRTFIHRIDPKIDKERAKVVGDLLFTGKVKGLSLVDRPAVPTHSTNGTGDPLITDSQMAVVRFE